MSYLNTLSTHKIYTDRFYIGGRELFPDIIDQLENVQSSVTDGLEDKVDQSVFDANVLSLMNELQTKQTKGDIVSINDTTDSVSKTTGSLKVSGGAGIAKNLHLGGSSIVPQGTNKGFFLGFIGWLDAVQGRDHAYKRRFVYSERLDPT